MSPKLRKQKPLGPALWVRSALGKVWCVSLKQPRRSCEIMFRGRIIIEIESKNPTITKILPRRGNINNFNRGF